MATKVPNLHYIKAKRGFSTTFLNIDLAKGKSPTVVIVKDALIKVLKMTSSSAAIQSDPLLEKQDWDALKSSDIELADIVNAADEEAKAFEFSELQEDSAYVEGQVLAWRLKSEKQFAVEHYPGDEQEE